MEELENLDQFPFVEARMLVGCANLRKMGLNITAAQAEAIFVERIISVPNVLSWKDTFSTLPSVYIEAIVKGEIKPNSDQPPLLLQYEDVFIAYSMGRKIALAKLAGIEKIEALVLKLK